jgi:hypothetical protein
MDSLRKCKTNHAGCEYMPFPRDQPTAPARLIKVGTHENDPIKLVDINTHLLPYAALSYCWGKGKTLTLQSESLDAFKSDISWNSLPLTYQQAVTLTRILQIPYLWIDAVCIIQEGGRDWQLESAKMADIFRNAEIVMSADAGSSTDTGFLFDRQPGCF